MPRENAESVKRIFGEALEKPPDQRAAYLVAACRGDDELRARVEALLAAYEDAGEFLAAPTRKGADLPAGLTPDARAAETREVERPGEGPGAIIGRYKLLQRIGEGGFGVVYMAEQQEPVRRKVALKIIKLGMDTKQVIARFEAERQALAMMDHPNIARVFDAGATETGRPYFVMELVKGVPITEYCDKNNLTTKDRLDLFMPVCNAVQHAHQKGIIHRDIKPTNVMVTLHDGKPVPKVIDFGIAKATDHRLTEKTLFTEYRQLVGTPAYMSPEQAEMSGLDVDTRTDVYSLGVLLYELLTGTTPFDAEKLRGAAYGEIQRIIREVEPPKPSTRISSLATESGAQAADPDPPASAGADIEPGRTARAKARGSVQDIARHRRTDPSTLSKLIRGDLDWIVMKALEKDRTRRYETAKELAKDVEHHLANEPILAGPPAAVYKLRKFIKRNRVAVTAGSLVAAALIIGLIVSTIGFIQASRQRDRAVVAEQQQSRERQRAVVAEQEQTRERERAESERDRATVAEQVAVREKQAARRQAYLANIAAANAALNMNNIGAVRRSLNAAPPEFRNWEWRYLDAQTDDSLAVLRGHEDAVLAVAFSPDGTRLATASLDDTVRLWDASTGKALATLEGHTSYALSVSFSPDGTRLASGSADATVRLWDVSSGRALTVLRGYGGMVNCVAFSPDNTRVAAGSWDNTVRIWDTLNGNKLTVLRGHEAAVDSVAFSPDGKRLASASYDGTLRLWNPYTGEEQVVLDAQYSAGGSIEFSPDGTQLASVSDGKAIHLWDTVTGTKLADLKVRGALVNSATFSPDGTRLASWSIDGTIRLLDAATGEELAVLRGHDGAVYDVAFSPDGTRLASAAPDKTVRLWDAAAGYDLAVLRGHETWVHSAAFSPDGTRVASGSGTGYLPVDNSVRIWDVVTGKELAVMKGHEGVVRSVAFSPDGARLASASWDGTLRLWDTFTGEELWALWGRKGGHRVRFSPDGTRLASAWHDNTVRICDALTGVELAVLWGHERVVTSVAFSPEGSRLATGSVDKTIRLWNTSTGQELAVFRGHDRAVSSVAFSPDGTRLASASSDDTVRLWDASTGEELAVLRGHERWVNSIAFSPDGTRLASGSGDATVRLWDASTGEELAVLQGHAAIVQSVAFSADGSRLVSTSYDHTVRIWHTKPYQVRYRERETIFAAQPAAELAVNAVWQGIRNAKASAKRLREDTSLGEPLRQAALSLLLSKSSQMHSQIQEHVDALYARLVLTGDVVAALEVDDTLAPDLRSYAVARVRTRGSEPNRLNKDSWNLVRSASGDQGSYEIGLRGAEAAVAAEPENAVFLGTLGVAQYRNGHFEETFATLTRCDQLRRQHSDSSNAYDLAVIAMALIKLDRIDETRATFEQLEEMMNDSEERWMYDEDAIALFDECKQLLEGSNTQTEPLENAEGDE